MLKIENQLDTKWKRWYLGKAKGYGFNGYGCFLFCWTYLYSVKLGIQVSPVEVDKIFTENGVYTGSLGNLIDSVKAAKVLGMQYLGKETNIDNMPAYFPTIKEVDFSAAPGKSQHFVVRTMVDGKRVILDPYGGVERPINYYEDKVGDPSWSKGGFSYRLIKI